MQTTKVLMLDVETIDSVWHVMEYELNQYKSFWEDDWTSADIYKNIKEHKLQVWLLTYDGVITCYWFTRITGRIDRQYLEFMWVFGSNFFKEFDLILETSMKFCAAYNLNKIKFQGRKGFARKVQKKGFEVKSWGYECLVPRGEA